MLGGYVLGSLRFFRRPAAAGIFRLPERLRVRPTTLIVILLVMPNGLLGRSQEIGLMERRAPLLAALCRALAGGVVVYAASAALNPYLLSIVAFGGINIILAVSLSITNGFTGLFSLGHPAFMTIGGMSPPS